MYISAKALSDAAFRESLQQFALTEAVLGIELSPVVGPSHLPLHGGSTEPAPLSHGPKPEEATNLSSAPFILASFSLTSSEMKEVL